MGQEKHIKYWLDSADKDWEVLLYLMKGKKYIHALFFGHLYLEKVCKAIWVKTKASNYPPKTHNLLKLLQDAHLNVSETDQVFLIKLNKYQIEGRYPDDIQNLYKITNRTLANEYISTIKKLDKWLRKQLQ